MASDWLAAVKARLKAATPGPWRKGQWEDGSQSAMWWNVFADASEVTVVVDTVEVDAEFIAACPTDLARCITELERKDRVIECYEESLRLVLAQAEGFPEQFCESVPRIVGEAIAEAAKIKGE